MHWGGGGGGGGGGGTHNVVDKASSAQSPRSGTL